MNAPLSTDEFKAMLDALPIRRAVAIAAGVSGGPDSMAMLKLLSILHAAGQGPEIHALTVDHGLRACSAAEAELTGSRVRDWPGVSHAILRWHGGGDTQSRIQEEARFARYGLMAGYARARGVQHLLLAHHMDDQAETVLFRLAKGSGLDGLCGMRPVQDFDGIILLRPFLGVSKTRLLATCEALGVEYAQDPGNENEAFARVRLRNSAQALADEGLTAARLVTTARRMARARDALESIASVVWEKNLLVIDTNRIVFSVSAFSDNSEEICVRIILRAVKSLRPGEDYTPRLERIEEITADIIRNDSFRKRTLGGLVFARDDARGQVVIEREHVKTPGA